jgi:hypothetical protein
VSSPGERPAELVDIQGAWQRGDRTLADQPPAEGAEVLWLQVGRYFCDLRTPHPQTDSTQPLDQPQAFLDRPQAFSGRVVLNGGAIAFHHDIDSLPRDPAHPDEGTVHRRGNEMVERGPGFEERWVQIALPGDDVGVAELRVANERDDAPLARIVRVGPVALAVWWGPEPGGAQFSLTDQWASVRALHDWAGAAAIAPAIRGLVANTPLPEGWTTIDPEEV